MNPPTRARVLRPVRVAVLLAIASAAVIAVLIATPRSHPRASPPPALTPASAPAPPVEPAPTAAQLRAAATVFGVFDRPRAPTDSLPASSAYARGVSRRVGAPSHALRVWAVAVGNQVCVTAWAATGPSRGGPAACDTVAELTDPDQLLVGASMAPASSSAQDIAGVAPRGVTSVTVHFVRRSAVTVPVANGGFSYVATDADVVSGFSWSQGGVERSEGG